MELSFDVYERHVLWYPVGPEYLMTCMICAIALGLHYLICLDLHTKAIGRDKNLKLRRTARTARTDF